MTSVRKWKLEVTFIVQTLAKTFSLAMLLILLFVQAVQGQDTKFIKGRVVDSAQRPVDRAVITLRPLSEAAAGISESLDGLVAEYKTDSKGRFRIPVALSPHQKALLYAATPVPRNAYAPLSAPFMNMTGESLFVGQPITISENGETNVGDVPVHVRYTRVVVHLRNSSGMPLSIRTVTYSSIWLRVRDARGDILSEGSVPAQAVHEDNTSLFLALPEGIWGIELALDGKLKSWQTVNKPLSIRASSSDLELILKVDNDESQERSVNNRVGFELRPEAARRELERLRIEFSADSFVERAAKGNQVAVELFLLAGMNVDTKDANGTPVLVAAANHPEIVKCLLTAGATVNLRNVDGDTALIHAAINGNTQSVLGLLSEGAEVNAKTKNGTTALMLAAGNGHMAVVRDLLAAGAESNTRNNADLSALDYAVRSGDEDTIRLLTQPRMNK